MNVQALRDIATTTDPLWDAVREEAARTTREEPILASFLHATLLNHRDLGSALSFTLANKLGGSIVPPMVVREIIEEAIASAPALLDAVRADLRAVRERDPACPGYAVPLLYFKGFQAIQAYRVAHALWTHGREALALFLQARISEVYSVDIHPAARIGHGILLDHATGLVVGETAIIEDNVSILQGVTLGGTGKETGDRHPKVRAGVLIGANATVLGNIEIGTGAKIGAGSVVLDRVPPHCTVVGVPARVVCRCRDQEPARSMDHHIEG
ncbi:serine O-acetyltransferase [Plasticicumulans acidivorans]|uniref:Serine acetyltransferase n=1 Tax=Plasticicumulans acidivorans TaxID=886464 RepID=A0A317MT84_9GAMM|nr:serine O-acetyltransferase [Plasticicumulans acidivorans]PWV60534.1 serine O-acetyltransferase [Plasticicumulans acidivorans]